MRRFYRSLGNPAAEWQGTEPRLGSPQTRRIFALLLLDARPKETDASRELLAANRFRETLWLGPLLTGAPVTPEVVALWDDPRPAPSRVVRLRRP